MFDSYDVSEFLDEEPPLTQEELNGIQVHIEADFPLSSDGAMVLEQVIREPVARLRREHQQHPTEDPPIEIDHSSLGALIRTTRHQRGLSLVEVAVFMGVELAYYVKLEQDKAPYRPDGKGMDALWALLTLDEEELERLAQALPYEDEIDPFDEMEYFDELANLETTT